MAIYFQKLFFPNVNCAWWDNSKTNRRKPSKSFPNCLSFCLLEAAQRLKERANKEPLDTVSHHLKFTVVQTYRNWDGYCIGFVNDAITNYHKLVAGNNRNCLTVLEARRSPTSKCQHAMLFLQTAGASPPSPLPSSWRPATSGVPWSAAASPQSLVVWGLLPPCVYLYPVSLLKRHQSLDSCPVAYSMSSS